jgi:HTH-type transcriptional regulator/antitoxin HigA
VLGRPLPTVNEIIKGKRAITPDMAVSLGAAFGNGADYWMKLEADYRLSLATADSAPVQRRARVFGLAPIKEMMRRGWIKESDKVEEIESEVCRFFGLASIEDAPTVSVATRKSNVLDALTPVQRAWCVRARQLASALPHVPPFRPDRVQAARSELRRLAAYPSEAKRIPEVMTKYGIRFVVVEPLSGAKIDGAAFWLADDQPVIAVSARFDRVDALWFTVMHEFAHIAHGDAASVDSDLAGDSQTPPFLKSDVERRADEEAARSLIDPAELESFVRRVSPLYSKDRIIQFAHRIKIHPGIIVGQLQHRGEISYRANREMLAKVRSHLVSTSLTDGWGNSVPSDLLD